jgi:hypothetical protein
MNTINNSLTSFYDNIKKTNKPEKIENIKKINNNEKRKDQSLYQGYQFMQYQDKIKSDNLYLDINNENNNDTNNNTTIFRENFANNDSTQIVKSLKNEYDQALQEYNNTLNQYNDLVKQTQNSSSQYIERIQSKNKYLNKVIRFSTGQMYYVTKQGVAKYIPNMDILNSISGKNGCPNTSGNYVNITIQWLDQYRIEGTQIPTRPPLIIGKDMKLNESCGNEGSNVFVNTMMSTTPTPKYVGCYQDDSTNPAMTLIDGKRVSQNNIIVNGNFSQPAIANDTYQYINSATKVPGWWFNACISNNSTAWGYAKPYPNGNQCASIQTTQSIAQTLDLSIGAEYTLTFSACGRNCCDNSRLSNPINVQLYTTTNQFVSTIYNFQPPVTNWTNYTTTFSVQTSQKYQLFFSGTWSSTDRSTAVQNIQLTSTSGGMYNFDQCENAAILGGYQYFALQNVNSSGMGFCALSNNIDTAKQYGPGFANVLLWQSKTSGTPATYAILTKEGTLSVRDGNNNIYYTTPNGTDCTQRYSTSWNIDAPGNDISYRTNVRRENCEQICNDDPSCSGFAWNRNTDSSCWLKAGRLSNTENNNQRILIKKTVDTSKCKYFLQLQTDGNMCIYRGEPYTSNITNIWCSNTNGKQQKPNGKYLPSKGKYGVHFLKTNHILNRGEWVSSVDGNLLLIMQTDGNLVLYTFKSNCTTTTINKNTVYYGGNLANPVYDIGIVGVKTNMGKLAFVDADSQIHPYSSNNITNSNTYSSVYQNTNIRGNDIPGAAISNITDINKCIETCNKIKDCNAFVYDTTGPFPVCLPKKLSENDISSSNKLISNFGTTTYIRDKNVINPPIGIDNRINNIDSLTYQNYGNQGGDIAKSYGLVNIVSVQKQQMSQLQGKLNLLSSQLEDKIKNLEKYNDDLAEDTKAELMKDIKDAKAKLMKDINDTEGFQGFDEFKNTFLNNVYTNTKIEKLNKYNSELDNMIRDTNIKTLQQNYRYMLWSILAVGLAIIGIKVKNSSV